MNEVSVYDGRRYLGRIVERDKGRPCEAFTASGATLGVFTSPLKAAEAVHEAANDRGQAA